MYIELISGIYIYIYVCVCVCVCVLHCEENNKEIGGINRQSHKLSQASYTIVKQEYQCAW